MQTLNVPSLVWLFLPFAMKTWDKRDWTIRNGIETIDTVSFLGLLSHTNNASDSLLIAIGDMEQSPSIINDGFLLLWLFVQCMLPMLFNRVHREYWFFRATVSIHELLQYDYACRKYPSVYIIYNALMPCCKRLSFQTLLFNAFLMPCYVFTQQTTNMNLIINETIYGPNKHTSSASDGFEFSGSCMEIIQLKLITHSHNKQCDENSNSFKYSHTQ